MQARKFETSDGGWFDCCFSPASKIRSVPDGEGKDAKQVCKEMTNKGETPLVKCIDTTLQTQIRRYVNNETQDALNCQVCKKATFNLIVWRHQCHYCKASVCDSCCNNKSLVLDATSRDIVKVCNLCCNDSHPVDSEDTSPEPTLCDIYKTGSGDGICTIEFQLRDELDFTLNMTIERENYAPKEGASAAKKKVFNPLSKAPQIKSAGRPGHTGCRDSRAVVMDCGSGWCKVGFAGDVSCSVFPTLVGTPRFNNHTALRSEMSIGRRSTTQLKMLTLHHPVQRGVVTNWEDMETIWNHVYRDELRVASEDHPVLLTEAPMNPTRNRERTVQIMFETFQVPALYVKMQAVLALLATGHTTGLAVDCGDGVTHAVPVLEGYAVDTAVSRLDLAGSDVTLQLMKILRERGNTFSTTAEREIVRGVKEKLSYVALDYQAELAAATANHGAAIEMSYELPDGNVIKLGAERFRCSELLFQPMLVGRDVPGLHECVHTSITHCDIDMRRELSANIFLSGGSTLMPGFGQRLTKEITALLPGGVAVKVHSPAERQHSVWLGGSVLASSESFGELWISKGDYAEFGENAVHKCF